MLTFEINGDEVEVGCDECPSGSECAKFNAQRVIIQTAVRQYIHGGAFLLPPLPQDRRAYLAAVVSEPLGWTKSYHVGVPSRDPGREWAGTVAPDGSLVQKPGKARWDLLPWGPISTVVDVLTFGAAKHPDVGATPYWATLTPDDHWAALQRHLAAWRTGEVTDPESGRPHLAHAASRILFLLAMGPSHELSQEL